MTRDQSKPPGWCWLACVNCKHFVHRPKNHFASTALCANPERMKGNVVIDPVFGETDRRRLRECEIERGRISGWFGGCGPSGRFFVARENEAK